ncbi:DNA-binding transcriptional ArsR family regulator [Lewinella marina]|uniref:Transcriptional regulator n=1 Tax=Neolewinella marina TaxID=438751 RepID=A0A2G0CE40_9BACT|nr:metalloregulator ArsR/SmtB family transcription factor [Neolewinella marina]NJB87452.1 DNA-binding transcriptional ArsR family regulator [Neolewinella marina]PHK98239.1 transcriptional regulator [Neolewinella marina]
MSNSPNPPSPDDSDKSTLVDASTLSKAVLLLRALNHDLRQQIIRLLSDKEQLTVTDIFISLRVEQSVASQHLAILRKANIVKRERQGKYILYSLDHERLTHVNQLVKRLAADL